VLAPAARGCPAFSGDGRVKGTVQSRVSQWQPEMTVRMIGYSEPEPKVLPFGTLRANGEFSDCGERRCG